ncbi:MAG: hypothetical protein SV375_06435 [Thermodesulfobacteriota bacterium]|nr:hypothetical protein [Thermodesulfobacteriota bacterium]
MNREERKKFIYNAFFRIPSRMVFPMLIAFLILRLMEIKINLTGVLVAIIPILLLYGSLMAKYYDDLNKKKE